MNPTTDLTRDRIMELKAGRQTDALIAEHIFGLPVVWSEPPYVNSGLTGMHPYLKGYKGDVHYDWPLVELYSSRIEAAFKVVEKMREEGFDVSITAPRGLGAGWHSGWYVHFWSEQLGRHSDNSQSLPECIAKCALLAKLR